MQSFFEIPWTKIAKKYFKNGFFGQISRLQIFFGRYQKNYESFSVSNVRNTPKGSRSKVHVKENVWIIEDIENFGPADANLRG